MSRYAALLGAAEVFRGNTLVLAPHPDDEIIALGGTLALLARAGVAVRVVHLTDGSGGDPEHRYDDIVAVRREEGRRALATLGQPAAVAFGFRDGALSSALGDVVPRLIEEIDRFDVRHVVAPSPLEAHPDHRAAATAVREVCAREPRTRVTDVSFYGVNAPVFANVLIDVTLVVAIKQRALEEHASQIAYNDAREAARGADAGRAINVPDATVCSCEALLRLATDRVPELFAAVERLQRVVFGSSGSGEAE